MATTGSSAAASPALAQHEPLQQMQAAMMMTLQVIPAGGSSAAASSALARRLMLHPLQAAVAVEHHTVRFCDNWTCILPVVANGIVHHLYNQSATVSPALEDQCRAGVQCRAIGYGAPDHPLGTLQGFSRPHLHRHAAGPETSIPRAANNAARQSRSPVKCAG